LAAAVHLLELRAARISPAVLTVFEVVWACLKKKLERNQHLFDEDPDEAIQVRLNEMAGECADMIKSCGY
jgi:hypothetical protein